MDREAVEIGRRDIKAAVDFIRKNYPAQFHQNALVILMREVGRSDLGAVEQIVPLLTGQDRSKAFAYLTQDWAKKDLEQLLKHAADHLSSSLATEIYGSAVNALTKRGELGRATEVLSRMPFSSQRSSAITDVGRHMADRDASGAIEWSSKLELQEDRETAQQAVFSTFAWKHDVDNLVLLSHSVSGVLKARVDQEIGRSVGLRGDIATLDQFDAADRAVLVAGAVETVPGATLESLSVVVSTLPESRTKFRAVSTFAGRLFEQDSQRAINWVNGCSPDLRKPAIVGLVSKWYNSDSEALSEWINTLPSGQDRDAALETLAEKLKRSDVASAKEVASKISDARARDSLLKTLLRAH